MLVKAQQGSLGAGIWGGEKSTYQYFMLRSKQTMFLLCWCLKKTIYTRGISNTVVTYFNCNLTKRPRGQGIILSNFYREGKSVTIFPPTNRRETFLILQIGLCSSHVFNEKSSGFQLSTADYSDLGWLWMEWAGAHSGNISFLLLHHVTVKRTLFVSTKMLPQSTSANLAEHNSDHLALVSHAHA